MIQILSASTSSSNGEVADSPESSHGRGASALSGLGVRRLVLQPMDARLEYMRDLRVWLRENGWRITQVGRTSATFRQWLLCYGRTVPIMYMGSAKSMEQIQGPWISAFPRLRHRRITLLLMAPVASVDKRRQL